MSSDFLRWASQKDRAEHQECEEAKAAIERVRELCKQEFGKPGHQMMNPGRLGYRRALQNVLRALDEDGEPDD